MASKIEKTEGLAKEMDVWRRKKRTITMSNEQWFDLVYYLKFAVEFCESERDGSVTIVGKDFWQKNADGVNAIRKELVRCDRP